MKHIIAKEIYFFFKLLLIGLVFWIIVGFLRDLNFLYYLFVKNDSSCFFMLIAFPAIGYAIRLFKWVMKNK